MIKYQLSDRSSPQQQPQHAQVFDAMLIRPSSSRQLLVPVYLNASTGTAIASVNGTLIIHVNADSYSSKSVIDDGDLTGNHDNNLTTTTLSYEQLSREFYESYDPSVGLHTAAVLGGILVWLVLYLIYKTKIRRCVVHFIKKIFGEEDEMNNIAIKVCDGEKDCSSDTNNSMIRNLINPSIVIESSPPQSPFTHDQYNPEGQDCLSPYSLPGTGHEDSIIFKFPNPDQAGGYQEACQCHSPCYLDPHELLLHLPKSQMDIRSATEQWVQNMPLASRSQQDFAGLMLSLKSHGLLAMNKPCSCPLVCPRTPQPLPLLDLPHTWNNSLPVLSNSLSSQILSAYEAVINQTKENDIKNLVNTTRTFKTNKERRDDYKNNKSEYACLIEKNETEKLDAFCRHGHVGFDYCCDKNRKSKRGQSSYSHENSRLVDNFALPQSPRPIPVTPTVMIQSSNPAYNHYRCHSSNTSISSSSSADALLAPPQSQFTHMPKPGASRLPSPHLLSPVCDSRSRKRNKHYSRSYVDLSGNQLQESSRSRSVSSHLCGINHQACSFKYQGSKKPGDTNSRSLNDCCVLTQYKSLCSSSNNILTTAGHIYNNPSKLSQQCRSFSDSTCGMADSKNQLSPYFPVSNHQRSLSADVNFSLNLQREHASPTYSNESNKSSLGASSRSHSPSPYLLQVPDPHNLFRPVTPDAAVNKRFHTDVTHNGPQSGMPHCAHSDSNIAYRAGQCFPVISQMDTPAVRRHSTFSAGPGEMINLSLCCNNTVRSSLSLGSSGTHTSSHHHSRLPYLDNKQRPQPYHQSTGMLRPDNKQRPQPHHQSTGMLRPDNKQRPQPHHQSTGMLRPDNKQRPQPHHQSTGMLSPNNKQRPQPHHQSTGMLRPDNKQRPQPHHQSTGMLRPDNKQRPQPHHQSTGMLRLDNRRQTCGLYSQTNLNRSCSAVIMETKL